MLRLVCSHGHRHFVWVIFQDGCICARVEYDQLFRYEYFNVWVVRVAVALRVRFICMLSWYYSRTWYILHDEALILTLPAWFSGSLLGSLALSAERASGL